MDKLNKWVKRVEFLSDKLGTLASFLLIPLMIIAFFEFIARYLFNSPTIWAWDINIQLFAVIVVFGGAYNYYHNMHVRVDVLFSLLPRRTQAIMDVITSGLVFLTLFTLLIFSTQEAWSAFLIRERSNSVWAPPTYPLKAVIPLGILLFLLQGVAHFLRNILVILHAKEK